MMPSSIAASWSVKPENAFLYALRTSSLRSAVACARKPSESASEITVLRLTFLARAIRSAFRSESAGNVIVVLRFLMGPGEALLRLTDTV